MSIDKSGIRSNVKGGEITIKVSNEHKLIKLANAIVWERLAEIIMPNLKKTTKKLRWWLGRPLQLRIHLGAYILQQLFNHTDRATEESIRNNAAYQIFCGKLIVKKWHCPDHTKIEEFRSRLSPETQQSIANEISKLAVSIGFADPSKTDIDSTIQEANMTYPSDANLMVKLGASAKKVSEYLNKKISYFQLTPLKFDITKIKSLARKYFFSPKAASEDKRSLLNDLWCEAYSQVTKILKVIDTLQDYDWSKMPWNIKRSATQLKEYAHQYFLDVIPFIHSGKIKAGKRLSFHLSQIACFNKGKLGKSLQFGRAFQLGRIAGNFLFVCKNETVRMEDKHSVKPMIETHQKLFGKDTLESVGTDKGYYSKENENYIKSLGIEEIGLQRPNNARASPANETDAKIQEKLTNRRAGIEPIIGHAKQCGQLGKSRMKSDETTESAGYCSVLAFNLRQLVNCLTNKNVAVLA